MKTGEQPFLIGLQLQQRVKKQEIDNFLQLKLEEKTLEVHRLVP